MIILSVNMQLIDLKIKTLMSIFREIRSIEPHHEKACLRGFVNTFIEPIDIPENISSKRSLI